MSYGGKRDYRKIDIFVDGIYKASTTWSRTCKEAKQRFLLTYKNGLCPQEKVKTNFSKKR